MVTTKGGIVVEGIDSILAEYISSTRHFNFLPDGFDRSKLYVSRVREKYGRSPEGNVRALSTIEIKADCLPFSFTDTGTNDDVEDRRQKQFDFIVGFLKEKMPANARLYTFELKSVKARRTKKTP